MSKKGMRELLQYDEKRCYSTANWTIFARTLQRDASDGRELFASELKSVFSDFFLGIPSQHVTQLRAPRQRIYQLLLS